VMHLYLGSMNSSRKKERKKEENRSKIVNDKSRILVRTQIASSIMRLCTSMCLEIKFFSEKESAVSIESRNINLLAAAYVLVTTDCPLKVLRSASVHLEVSWRQVFLWKRVRCIERISHYTSVARLLRPYYNRLPSESVTKCVCAPRSVLESSFSLKASPLYRKNLAIYVS
jgi:hypothetical protein